MSGWRHGLLCAAAVCNASHAQDTLLMSLQGDRLSTGEQGQTITAGRVFSLPHASIVAASVQAQRFSGAQQYAGMSEGLIHLNSQTNVLTGINVGRVDTLAASYWYYSAKLGLQWQVSPRYGVRVADQYFDSYGTHGQLFSIGNSWSVAARWLIAADVAYTLTGNIDNRYAMARIDRIAIVQLYGGAIAGQTRNIVSELQISARAQSYHQFFGGVSWLRSTGSYSFDWSSIYIGAIRHHTVGLTAKWLLPP